MDKLKLPIPVTVSGLATSLFQTSGFYTPKITSLQTEKKIICSTTETARCYMETYSKTFNFNANTMKILFLHLFY